MNTATTAPARKLTFYVVEKRGVEASAWQRITSYKTRAAAINRMCAEADNSPRANYRVRTGEGETLDIHATRIWNGQ